MMKFIRLLLEGVLKDKTRKRNLPASVGGLPIYASAAGGLRQLIMPMDKVDPDLFLTAERLVRSGDTVWDVGANVGLFSFASAGLTGTKGQVISFEPDAHLVTLLRKSASLQDSGTAKITIVPAGIAGETGIRTFHIAKRARASNSLADYGNEQKGGIRQSQSIACFSLDEAVSHLSSPTVIKIDVEGAEVEILAAAKKLFTEIRPRIAVESAPSTQDDITEIFKKNNYHIFDANGDFTQSAELDKAVWNTLAIPSEQLDFVAK